MKTPIKLVFLVALATLLVMAASCAGSGYCKSWNNPHTHWERGPGQFTIINTITNSTDTIWWDSQVEKTR
jgi:hypothetical protein